jgi:hypothetical protein
MDAATKGFIEFQIDGLTPHKIQDMAESDPFWAHVEILTHRGNLIGMTSEDITAKIDTEENIHSATKYNTDVTWVSASEIPADKRKAGESDYVVVTWYMYSYMSGNTEFTLSSTDTKADDYEGFILSPTTDSQDTYTNPSMFSGYTSGSSDGTAGVHLGYQTVKVAYPGSQFQPNTQYIFRNNVSYTVTECSRSTSAIYTRVTRSPSIR